MKTNEFIVLHLIGGEKFWLSVPTIASFHTLAEPHDGLLSRVFYTLHRDEVRQPGMYCWYDVEESIDVIARRLGAK